MDIDYRPVVNEQDSEHDLETAARVEVNRRDRAGRTGRKSLLKRSPVAIEVTRPVLEPPVEEPPVEVADEERESVRTLEHPGDREFVRLAVVVEVTLSSDHNFWTGFTENISEGGLFVTSREPLPEGSVLRFRFRLLPDPAHHEVMGEVRWVRPVSASCDDLPPGMGVRFMGLSQDLTGTIQRFMAHQRDSLFFDCDDDLG